MSIPIRAALLAAILLSLSGAAQASRPGASVPERTPPAMVTVVDSRFDGSLKPWWGLGTTDSLLFAPLLTLNAQGQLQPELLHAVPSKANHQIDDQRRTVTLRLRSHLLWSSGAEITAADIAFGWHVAMDPASGPLCAGSCDAIASITVSNRYTAIVHFKQLDPVALFALPPVLPHGWKALGPTAHSAALQLYHNPRFTFIGHLPGDGQYWTSGPYQAEKLAGPACVLFGRMPRYRVHSTPAIAQIKLCSALPMGGVADIADPRGFDTLSPQGLPIENPSIVVKPFLNLTHLEFNAGMSQYQDQVNPLHDVRVRQALALSTDKLTLVRTVLHGSLAQARALIASSPFYAPRSAPGLLADRSLTGAWSPFSRRFLPYGPQALADARTLLKTAGYGNGLTVTLTVWNPNSVNENTARELQRQWEALGVRVTIEPVPACSTCAQGFTEGRFEILLRTVTAGLDPTVITPLLSGAQNYSGIQDGQLDQAVAQGLESMDPATRAPAYRRIERIVSKGAYWLPLFHDPIIFGVSRRLAGVSVNPIASETWDIYHWRLRSE